MPARGAVCQPASPDLNQIEQVFVKLKPLPRKMVLRRCVPEGARLQHPGASPEERRNFIRLVVVHVVQQVFIRLDKGGPFLRI
jgi:hypothetical protein